MNKRKIEMNFVYIYYTVLHVNLRNKSYYCYVTTVMLSVTF